MSRGAAALLLLAAACHEFLPIEGDNRCGNLVVEPSNDEDCDGIAEAGTVCGKTGAEACKLTCAPLSDGACPSGWACGQDGLCRRASARFGAPRTIDLSGVALAIGDLDADGFGDMVSSESVTAEVRYGDPAGNFGSAVSLLTPVTNGPTALGDLDGEPGDEMIFPVGSGIMLVPGRRDRTLTPRAFTSGSPASGISAYVPIAVRAIAPYTRQVLAVIYLNNGAIEMAIEGAASSGADAVKNALRNVRFDDQRPFADRFAVADIDAAGNTPEEIALAIRTAGNPGSIAVVSPTCTQAAMAPPACTIAVRANVPLPSGFSISETGTFFADVDGDGDLDLLATVTNGGPREVAISLGDGRGGFATMAVDRTFSTTVSCAGCPPGMIEGAGPIVDAGDLDGDGKADYVLSNGVALTQSRNPLVLNRVVTTPTPYGQAVIARLSNGDTIPDIVTTTGQLDVTVLFGLGAGRFLAKEVQASEAPSHLRLGDFNADTFVDLAFVEEDQRLVVMYADGRGVPSERVVIANLKGVGGLESWIDSASPDYVADLFAVEASAPAGMSAVESPRLYRFQGSSTGRMLATMNLGPPIFGAAIGYFASRGADPRQALLFAGGGGVLSFWMMRASQIEAGAVPSPTQITGEGCGGIDAHALDTQVADIDGDGLDEIVAVNARTPLSTASTPLIIAATDDRVLCRRLQPTAGLGEPGDIHVADIDGDGAKDLLVDFTRSGGPMGGEPGAVIWWGKAGATPPFEQEGMRLEGVRYAAPIDVDRDGAAELVIDDDEKITLHKVTNRALASEEAGKLPFNGVAADVRTIRTSDTDADGLMDLVIGTFTQVTVVPRLACKPEDTDTTCQGEEAAQ